MNCGRSPEVFPPVFLQESPNAPSPRGGIPRGLRPMDSRARGVRLGPFGRFLVIFQTFEQIKIFEKCFYKFKRHIQNVSNKSSRTCPGDAQIMSET